TPTKKVLPRHAAPAPRRRGGARRRYNDVCLWTQTHLPPELRRAVWCGKTAKMIENNVRLNVEEPKCQRVAELMHENRHQHHGDPHQQSNTGGQIEPRILADVACKTPAEQCAAQPKPRGDS